MLAALLPLLAAMVAAWAIATFFFTRTLEQRVADQLTDTADVLTRANLPFTSELLQRVADLERSQIALLDADGTVIRNTSGDLASRVAPLITASPGVGAGPQAARRLTLDGEPLMAISRAVPAGNDARATTLLIAASLRDARDAARRAALAMGLAVLAAGTLLVALQYLLVRSVTQPIGRLAAMANDIAAGRRDVHAGPVPHGELQALATALDDMTAKLQSYESELAERSRLAALGEMSARIAHEIRNPLTGLKLHLQLLDERAPLADKPTLRRLLDEVGRLELIVASSLSLKRPQPAELREADLNKAVDEVLQLMEPSLRHRRIDLRRELGEVPKIAIDRDRIKQAVLNLLVNASDALPDGGTVLARSSFDPTRDVVAISIEDSGPGMDPKLNEPSGTPHGSSKPFGLGLGLRLCREIVTEHLGTLDLGRSKALGGGRATIEIPARPAS
jgi:signal transduction histidine kinase